MNIELYVAPLRAVVESKLQAFLEYESGGLAASMLIGTRMDSDQSLYAHAKVIGIFDIFSVSGMHVSNLWSITSSLSAFVLKGKRMVTIVSLTILILYMLFVGFQLPIIRAVVMRVVSVLVAQTTGIFLSPALVLLVLCVCYYCTDKSVFTKISFQFSYLVTFLLVAFGSSSLMQNRHLRIERLRVNSLVQDVQQFALQS